MKASRIVVMVIVLIGLVGIFAFTAGEPEESVVVYSAGPGGLATNIAQGFEEKTGIKVDLYQATTGDVLGRLEAEADRPHADVVVLASWPAAFALYENGWLAQYEPENADKLIEGWNYDNYFFGYSASALGIVYNTNEVDDPGQDWGDFADERFRDVVAMPDPAQSGSCLDFVTGYVLNYGDEAWELFETLAANGLEVAGPNRPALDSVVTAANFVVLAGVDYMTYGAMAEGSPVDMFYPESGTVVNPRPAMMTSWSNNPEGAQAFLDYMLSDEAQQFVADDYILPGRADVEAHPDRVGYADIPVLDLDWDWMAENQGEVLTRFQQIIR